MRSKFKWIYTLLIVLSIQLVSAQEKTVTELFLMILALPGVNVVVRGTKSSAQTNFNGESIKAKTGDVLVFSLLVWLSPQPKLVVHQLLILKCRVA
jgi:hypothetical protein